MKARLRLVAILAVAVVSLSGCEFRGLNSEPLPLTLGGNGYKVTVIMANAVNLVPNSQVKLNDVNVGSVRRIDFDHWKAKLTLGIEKGVRIPADSVAKIAQKSLLGAEYLEIDVPPTNPSGKLLTNGSVIGLDNSGRYPETEEVLSSLSLLLNGGGLGQIKTITTELNKALGGRQADVRSLLGQLDTLTATLNDQKQNIVEALNGLNRLSGTFSKQNGTLDQALVELPKGINTLATQQASLTRTLNSLGTFGDVVHRITTGSQADLGPDLTDLATTLQGVANSGTSLVKALPDLSFPFPVDTVPKAFKGDYINFFATIDLTADAISRDFLGGQPLNGVDGILTSILGMIPTGATTDHTNPLTNPLKGGSPATSGPKGLGSTTKSLLGGLLGGLGVKGPKTKPTSPSTPAPGLGGLLGSLLGGGA